MKAPDFWKTHYVVQADAQEIARRLTVRHFASGRERFELLAFEQGHGAPSIVISPGSGGHAYVFAELGYAMHRRGYNVFILPKHGGATVLELMQRHRDALDHVGSAFGGRIGLYGEGLGGYVAFYLALAQAPMKSLACQNSPALLTEAAYHEALLHDGGAWRGAVRRRRIMLPVAQRLVRAAPWLRVPIWTYLDWEALIDPRAGVHAIERTVVREGYLRDPDFDRWAPLSHAMSLINTPPPKPLAQLQTPTLFVLASGGPTPTYIRSLYERLPPIQKRLVQVEGSVYWMLSHPQEASRMICDWFDETV